MTTDIGATKADHDLLEIAARVVSASTTGEIEVDPDLTPILGDAVLEMGWTHPAVMPLVLGVSLDDEPPRDVRGYRARQNWEARREAGYELSQAQWDLFAGRDHGGNIRPHAKWVRAVYAVLLFSSWLPPMRSTPRAERWSTRSPWPLIRYGVARWNEAERNLPRVYSVQDVTSSVDGIEMGGVSALSIAQDDSRSAATRSRGDSR